MLNIPDEVIAGYGKDQREDIHPKSLEMTLYQKQMALVSDRMVVVSEHAKAFFRRYSEFLLKK